MEGLKIMITNRCGFNETLSPSKIEERLSKLALMEPKLNVSVGDIVVKAIQLLPEEINTVILDEHTAHISNSMSVYGNDYGTLASRILVNSHHKNTMNNFVDKVHYLDNQTRSIATAAGDIEHKINLYNRKFVDFVNNHAEQIENKIDYSRDYLLSYPGIKTLLGSYLLRDVKNKVIERWQDAIMRVAIGIHLKDAENLIDQIFELYDTMSQHMCTHATPTIFNAGLMNGQLSSCFLMGSDDSLPGIMKTASDAAQISKYAGGIGIHNMWRGNNSYIRSTNGWTNGKLPFYGILSAVSHAVDQGGSKRKGSLALYETIHDADIETFLNMRKIAGENKNRVLFIAVWIHDIFMKRVKEDGEWNLFSSDQCPDLNTTWGEDYEKAYTQDATST
jgi:ribonucleoside-diphosphate reductase subunit M1